MRLIQTLSQTQRTVKNMENRAEKYKAKINGDVAKQRYDATKELSVKQEKAATEDLVKIEEQVKSILPGVSTILIPYYIIFAKEIYRLKSKHTSATLEMELCGKCRKWWVRGLEPQYLNRISLLYTGMACFDVGKGLPRTGQTTSYVNYDDGWYKAGLPAGAGVRFTDNGDGTISDNATGLMWIKDPIASPGAPFDAGLTWNDAITSCEALDYAGQTDWRLPNIFEIISIVDYSKINPSINATFFPNTVNSAYWSSTANFANTKAYEVYFVDGSCSAQAFGNTYWVRPVRGGQLNH